MHPAYWILLFVVLGIMFLGLVFVRVRRSRSRSSCTEIASLYHERRGQDLGYDEISLEVYPKASNPPDLLESFTWVDGQSIRVRFRRERLLAINGLLSVWMKRAEEARDSYLRDRDIARLFELLSDESKECLETLEHSRNKFIQAKLGLSHVAEVLLTQLSVEVVRKTYSLVKGDDARHQWHLEVNVLGQNWYEAKLFVETLDAILAEPVEMEGEKKSGEGESDKQ